MVVDPWTVQLARYGKYATEYDTTALSWSTIIVCWNGADRETQQLRSQLERNLRAVFQNKFRARSPDKWRDQIETVVGLGYRFVE
jgi:hypothetical protein